MTAPQTHFTSAQIAAALGRTPRAVRLRLEGVAPSGEAMVRGQKADGWSVAALPQSLRADLAAAAQERGLPEIENLLQSPPAPFQAPRPWHTVPVSYREVATKLCAALSPLLPRQHELPGAELMELARASYRQHFGNDIAADKLRYVMDRATRRDNGFKQWDRPELYLDDAAWHPTAPASLSRHGLHHDEKLEAAIAAIKDKSQPTADDKAFLFHAAFKHLENLTAIHTSKAAQRDIKNSLVTFLYQSVPGLYRPHAASLSGEAGRPLLAVRKLFNLSHAKWVKAGRMVEALMDSRVKNGRKGYEHEPCDKLIKAHAALLRGSHGKMGNLDLAIKLLSEKVEICVECICRYAPGRLTAAARARLTPNAIQVAHFKGADAIRAIAPTHHCDWSDTEAGDRFVIDDMTPNEVTWDEVDGQVISGQAQMLFTEDERSGYPLPFLLYIGAPNGNTIKKAIALVLRHVGLPHVELVTERGVFAARKIAGDRNVKHQLDFRQLQAAMETHFKFDAIPDEVLSRIRSLDLGLRDPAFRLNISQARSPQAKTVERGFYEFQKGASRLPGFAGFNQREEKSRAMQDFDRRVAAGNEHPGNEYLRLSELRKNYELIWDEIKNRPSNGMRCRGLSPAQMWKEAVDRRPLRKLPPEIEAHLTTHRLPQVKVRSQGIRISLDCFEDAFYFNGFTGAFVGKHVAVRINHGLPDFIYIEEPGSGKLLKVPRVQTRRRTATPEEISASNRARRAHISGALGEVGNVENLYTSHVIRDSIHNKSDMQKGAQIAADAAEHQQAQTRLARKQTALQTKAASLGVIIPAKPVNQQRVGEGLDLLAEADREIAELRGKQTK